jgi:hypothetical protein
MGMISLWNLQQNIIATQVSLYSLCVNYFDRMCQLNGSERFCDVQCYCEISWRACQQEAILCGRMPVPVTHVPA